MKKILFVSTPMNVGGVEKSLLSLFDYLKDKEYSIFFMPYRKGEAKWNKYIPSYVKIVKPPEYLEMVQIHRDTIWKYIIKNLLHPRLMFNYLYYIVKGLFMRNMTVARQEFWENCQSVFPAIEETYDIVVAWEGEMGSYFIIDKITASRKISWYHWDYSNCKRDKRIDEKYWKQLNVLVCVAESGANSVLKAIPGLSRKIVVCHNIISKEMIYSMAGEYLVERDEKKLKLLSLGRLNPVKGFDMAIEAAESLKGSGIDFVWYIVGGGASGKEYKAMIEKMNLRENVFLIGELDNPYPYFIWCDIFVHTARAEGKPLVIDEAKLFCKPIVSTNFSTVYDQLENGVNGKIVDMDALAIAEGIMEMDVECRKSFCKALQKEYYDSDAGKILEVFDGKDYIL